MTKASPPNTPPPVKSHKTDHVSKTKPETHNRKSRKKGQAHAQKSGGTRIMAEFSSSDQNGVLDAELKEKTVDAMEDCSKSSSSDDADSSPG